jgi:2-C-methyl-D-erythritol 4-phosphate cytidylyltransferase/2-C-methyl-D-erythritol 2,4-cyclodiphosphate synthase
LWFFVAKKFKKSGFFKDIIIVSSLDDIEHMRSFGEFTYTEGGNTRQQSLRNAIELANTEYTLVSDIARSCIDNSFLQRILSFDSDADCIVPFLPVTDTIVYDGNTIDRDKVKRVQTPQLSRTSVLAKALQSDNEYTDESSAIAAFGGIREFIPGDEGAHKITHISDLNKISCLSAPSKDILSGNGFDVHAFDDKGEMYLGGVKIDSDFGFKAHSDGDVAIHALIDALLGAASMGDIGMLFPDNDDKYKGIDSKELLRVVVKKLYNYGYQIINVDITIAAQKPRIAQYKQAMREVLSEILNCSVQRVNVKATTTEKLGFVGRAEGVAVIANANLKYFDWQNIIN